MCKAIVLIFSLILGFGMIVSCEPNRTSEQPGKGNPVQAGTTDSRHQDPHPFGGWYCPDNFGGFPPVDIQDLDQIPVVMDRLPTEEETRSGTSLMYIDPTEYPDARPLIMRLPRVARIHSRHTGIHELIIVIQVAIVGDDTLVGYRFPSGGNGSAWLGEVTFLSEDEVAKLGSAPMVYRKAEINASKEKIWSAFTETDYARGLGKKFHEETFFSSGWTDASEVHLNVESGNDRASGFVATVYGNLYLQIDYVRQGDHFTEKLLLVENTQKGKTEMHLVSGPHPRGMESQTADWEKFFHEVKQKSEMKK